MFALVIYIPDPLGRFLDDLRRELVPGCNPHAHVSVLPPRRLTADWQVAGEQARACAKSWSPFEISLGGIQKFPVTNVLYIEVARGATELHRMHAAMNTGLLNSAEPFEYHPHITLAQELAPEHVDEVNLLAQRRWAEYRGPRTFLAEHAAFVRNTAGDSWADLAVISFSAAPLRAD
jgi:2'-5' RNA ligase